MQAPTACLLRNLLDWRAVRGVAPNTMTKLRRDEEVSMAVLIKICTALDANIGDIMDLIPEERN